jgi:TRAP-type C4-dicarboxylate transport system substrate-binding protein
MSRFSTTILALFVLCLAVGPSAMAAEEVYTFSYQSYYPAGNQHHITDFAKEVEEASKGRLQIKVYSAGELVSSANMLKAVRSGMLDMAHDCSMYFTELSIGAIGTGLPLAWMSAEEAEQIFSTVLDKALEDDFAKAGTKYLGSMWAAPYHILSKTPINSLDDLRKMKIRSIGSSARMLNNLGVATVSMPPEDVYLAMATGQVDGCLYGAAFEYELNKFYEAAPYFCNTPITDPVVDVLIVNPKKWNKLPKDLQDVIIAAQKNLKWAYYNFGLKASKKSLETVFKGKTTTLSTQDIATMTAAAQQIWDEEAAKSPVHAKIIEALRQLAKSKGRL